MADVLVIGDDLTGSNATGVLYAKTGRRVVTVVDLGAVDAMRDQVDVLVVDTESRHLAPAEAAQRVRDVVAQGAGWGLQIVKRVDTTLRGNVGAEVEAGLLALREVCPLRRQVALMVPAFPSSGRTTAGGMQFVGGVPLYRTEAAKDPFSPVRHSGVAQILGDQSGLRVACVSLDAYGDGLGDEIARAAAQADVVVVDAIDDDDIRTVAAVAAGLEGIGWLIVDSGPFGAAFAQARGSRGVSGAATGTVPPAGFSSEGHGESDEPDEPSPWLCAPEPKRPDEPSSLPLVLVIAGSLTEQTNRQLDRLAETGAGLVEIDPATAEPQAVVAQLRGLVEDGRRIVGVRTTSCDGTPTAQAAGHALRVLGDVALAAASGLHPGGVYATGGDVARTVLSVLGGNGFRLIDEVLPLAVVGAVAGGEFDGSALVTKGGLIGDDDAAVACVTMLQRVAGLTGTQQPAQATGTKGESHDE